jgi:hypothetical protein
MSISKLVDISVPCIIGKTLKKANAGPEPVNCPRQSSKYSNGKPMINEQHTYGMRKATAIAFLTKRIK